MSDRLRHHQPGTPQRRFTLRGIAPRTRAVLGLLALSLYLVPATLLSVHAHAGPGEIHAHAGAETALEKAGDADGRSAVGQECRLCELARTSGARLLAPPPSLARVEDVRETTRIASPETATKLEIALSSLAPRAPPLPFV